MTFTVTIGGVAVPIRAGSLEISRAMNERTTTTFVVMSRDGSYRPALGAEVLIEQDSVRVLGGLVSECSERGMFGAARPGIQTTVTVVDFNGYPERKVIRDGGFPAGYTLKQALTSLAGNLAVYGVTLDAGQVDGPVLPELRYVNRRVDDILNELATISTTSGEAYVWRIDDYKVLRMVQPSTETAPFAITSNAPPDVVGDITVDLSRSQYANRVIVTVAPKTESGRTESFAGDGVTDTFTLKYTPTHLYGHILVASGGGETLANVGDTPEQWQYDASTNQITRLIGPSVDGETYTLYFDGFYAGEAIAEDPSATTDPWELVVQIEEVPDGTTLQAQADALLAEHLAIKKAVTYKTFTHGLRPGQQQSLTVPARNLSVDSVVSEVVVRDRNNRLVYEVSLDASSWRQVYRIWAEVGTGGGSVSVGDSGPGNAGPAAPFTAVQFNRLGKFGGDDAFTYNDVTDSVVCGGGGSSITAVSHQSCQVFGEDCHIADP